MNREDGSPGDAAEAIENVVQLQQWLRRQGVDAGRWQEETAKSVHNLWVEVKKGETRLQEDPPRRLVEVVQVIVRRGERVLIEACQDFENGQRRGRRRPPAEKMRPGEHYLETALRCLSEELGVAREAVQLFPRTYEQRREEAPSASYPGLITCYVFHQVEAEVAGLPRNDFATVEEATGPGDAVRMHYWQWAPAGALL